MDDVVGRYGMYTRELKVALVIEAGKMALEVVVRPLGFKTRSVEMPVWYVCGWVKDRA